MSERQWILSCVAAVALRVRLKPGETLVATRSGRLVICDHKPNLPYILVLRSTDGVVCMCEHDLLSRLSEFCWRDL